MDIKFSCGHIHWIHPDASYDEKDVCPYCKRKEREKEEEKEFEEYLKKTQRDTKEEDIKFSDLTWKEFKEFC